MRAFVLRSSKAILLVALSIQFAQAGTSLYFYYAHAPEVDLNGVIAPWYKGQNGQYDFRVRIAAETVKRYPWATADRAVVPAPEYLYNGTWAIDYEGRITVPPEENWANGDLGQRAAVVLSALINYYRYSGDASVRSHITAIADYLVDYCQTGADHGWPKMLISVPTLGKRYGQCVLGPSDDLKKGEGKIQLDIVAEVGLELVRAYEMTGNQRWYDAAKHWADLLAHNRNRQPGAAPWGRYANNAKGSGMNGIQTASVSYLLMFFDELIRTGYRGPDGSIVEAQEAGQRYLRDVLLPAWLKDDTWGRNYWDWEDPVQAINVTDHTAIYMMDHKDYFPNWKVDVRNILSLFLNHMSASPLSRGDAFTGAWAYPESSGCCDRSLWYGPLEFAMDFARYGAEADSEWAREIGRRSILLATYDPLPDGETMDLIDGGSYVNRTWFKIAQPSALLSVLLNMGWLPDVTGANRENHLMRTSRVVKHVVYGKDTVSYSTFDSPADSVDVLRLAYAPTSITASGKSMSVRSDLAANGFTVRRLSGGDSIVSIRHDNATEIIVHGPDPQQMIGGKQLALDTNWQPSEDGYVTSQKGASMTVGFTGNQVRLVGRVQSNGGLADVYVDDFKQLVPVDFYSPEVMEQQILYYRNGLAQGRHTLKLAARGAHNPLSKGMAIFVEGVQYSAATGDSGFGEGGGPTGAQRMIFGYPERKDYLDSKGHAWRPATEFVARTGNLTDVVAETWWTMRQAVFIMALEAPQQGEDLTDVNLYDGDADQELYRYGAHWKDFTANLTVGPGRYHVRLKFAENQYDGPNERGVTIFINGKQMVEGMDVFATAGGAHRAVDLVYNNIEPKNGIIEVRFVGSTIEGTQRDAMVQALEVGPGDDVPGAVPKVFTLPR